MIDKVLFSIAMGAITGMSVSLVASTSLLTTFIVSFLAALVCRVMIED